ERAAAAADAPVTLLDIPVVTAPVNRRPKAKDADQLLDSVLEALPQPKQPGQGRSRSRRVSTAAIAGGSVAPEINRTEPEE
ncbi:MAG: ribonuclease, partial [Nocardioidaceae bacterium]|nr:ribonuclease [Nocardioidaceae bacterium]